MADAVRRSSRRSKPSSNSTYSIGDIVELTRNGVVVEGRLVYKLTTGTSPNPRWLVKFDKEPSWKDEELYEHVFLRKADSPPIDGAPSKTKANRNVNSSKRKQKASSNSSSSSSSEAEGQATAPTKKSVTFSQESSPAGSEGEEAKSALALAREERSKRRQAKVREDDGNHDSNKRSRPNNNKNSSNKKARCADGSDNDEVIKVPMLTGTLYLYRGLYRRAEFVRKI